MKKSDVVNWEELITSDMLLIEAIFRILEHKGIVTHKELIEEVKDFQKEMSAKIRKWGKEN